MDRGRNTRFGRRWYVPQLRRPRISCEFCAHQRFRERTGGSWKINETMRIYGMHKSQSDLGLHSGGSADSLQLLQERTERYLADLPFGEQLQDDMHLAPREEVRMSLATIQKKGLIKLQSADYNMKDPAYYEKQRNEQSRSRQRSGHSQISTPSLIKRKDILDKIKEGQRLLEEEERNMLPEEEEEKEMGEYTVADLQKNINQLTDINTLRRNNESAAGIVSNDIPVQRKAEHQSKLSSFSRSVKGRISVPPSQSKDKKKLGPILPAINLINPF